MPLSADDFVQENSGTVATPGTSCVVSLPSGTTAGNTVLVLLTSLTGVTQPAGFTLDKVLSVNLWAFSKSEVASAETSWTFTAGAGNLFAWYAAEVANVGVVEPLDASAVSGADFASTSNGGTRSTGTAGLNASLNTVVLGAFAALQAAGSTESWSAEPNGFEEVADVAPGVNAAYALAVARKFVTGTTGAFETTATLATSQASTMTGGLLVAYRAADSPIVAPLAMLAGFEGGTHGGINSHNGSDNLMGSALTHGGTWGTSYLVQAASARTSSYGLRVVAAGAVAYTYAGNMAAKSASFGFNARVVSASGTVVVAEVLNNGLAAAVQLLYDASASKFGVRCGSTGTTSWQSGTTATNTWVWVDLRVRINTTTWHADWRLETAADTYTDQAYAELTGQSAAGTILMLRLGSGASQTMTADFDDVCLSAYYVAYPLGPHQVRLLTVDQAGTPTVSGTSTNFSRFTANGTLAAIDAATAALLVDEVPPTVSASADGVCQTATAASDYIEFPMATPTLAADEIVAGVRMLAAMWGGTGAGTGQVGIRSWDGTTETILIAASVSYDAGSPTAISSTEPRWQCAMWPAPNGWTVAKLLAAALRFGFSPDAAPDMGTDAMYLEYATKRARQEPLFGASDAELRVESDVNPHTYGIRALRAYAPANQGATLIYEVSGVEQTPVPVAAGSNPQVVALDAPDMATINRITMIPDEPT